MEHRGLKLERHRALDLQRADLVNGVTDVEHPKEESTEPEPGSEKTEEGVYIFV